MPELEGKIFDAISAKKADHFEVTLIESTHYTGKEFKHGADICITIIYLFCHIKTNETEETSRDWNICHAPRRARRQLRI